MPIEDGVGYGEVTRLKMEAFTKIARMHIAITRAVLQRNGANYGPEYRYLDLTAGKGRVPGTNDHGSPLAFLCAAGDAKPGLRFVIDLVEIEQKNIEELKAIVDRERTDAAWNEATINFHFGSYQQAISTLLPSTSKQEFGLVFVDPSGDLPDFGTLSQINARRPKMEILIYIATTNVKRVKHYTARYLTDFMAQVGKNHWLVRRPSIGDRHKWTFLLGSNTDLFKNYKKIDFYRTDSDDGAAILERLNLTEDEIQGKIQPRLL